jgi:hypothetical protein
MVQELLRVMPHFQRMFAMLIPPADQKLRLDATFSICQAEWEIGVQAAKEAGTYIEPALREGRDTSQPTGNIS